MSFKKFKQHMPAVAAGVCCWAFISVVAGTACWFRAIFGLPCPGCGSSRAIISILRGDLRLALWFHPLIFLSIALIILAAIFRAKLFRSNYFTAGVFALYMLVYMTRMILLFPDTEPMTYLDASLLGRFINLIGSIIYL